MRFIYKNITETTQILTLLSDDKTQVTSIPLGAGARVEVSNGNLDIYVPHILARVDENGYDISHTVVQAVAADTKSAELSKSVPEKVVVANEPVVAPIAPVEPTEPVVTLSAMPDAPQKSKKSK